MTEIKYIGILLVGVRIIYNVIPVLWMLEILFNA
jgi:hypothetical protein